MLSALVSTRFQVLFHSPPGVLFTFPSQYCYAIGHWVVFRLGGWSPHIPTGFHVSGGTLDTAALTQLRVHDYHILRCSFPTASARVIRSRDAVRTPAELLQLVWPLPRSLATTSGISVDFFSSPYLDVSVQAVPLVYLCIQYTMTRHDSGRISPFGNPRIDACLRLPVAYRR